MNDILAAIRTHSFKTCSLLVALLLLASLAPGRATYAAILSYEGFDYADGTSVIAQTGGAGWANAWNKSGNAAAMEIATTPGLNYAGLQTSGNKATLTAQQNTGNGNSVFAFRDPSTAFGTDGTTVWLSFIGQRTGAKGGTPASYQRVYGLSLFNGATEQAAVGELSNDPADTWNLIPDVTTATGVMNSQHTTVPIDTLAFHLLRINFGAGDADTASLWVNPNLALGEAGLGTPSATIAKNLTFNRLRMSAGGSQSTGPLLAASGLIDEIRIGETFADVAPVPEPHAFVLGALAALAASLAAQHRRRQA